jgi:alpha-1,2-rhamnosyltransferase
LAFVLPEGITDARFRRKQFNRVTPQKNGLMSERETDKSKINTYLLDVLSSELEEANRYAISDPLLRFAFDRLRELIWTTTRAFKKLVAVLKGDRFRAKVPAGEALAGDIPAPPARGRVLIDMTHTVDGGFKTGIQRVVREIARNCVETGAALPVTIHAGGIFSHYRHAALPLEIEPGPGDILLLLDACWNNGDDYPPLMRRFKARGGKTVVAVYDILPLDYPSLFRPFAVAQFRAWRERIVGRADAAVAISRATAENLYEDMRDTRPRPPIGWWPLGADFTPATGEPSATAVWIAAGPAYFLGVGTLEPRKAYPVAIEAFELLWAEGHDIRYVIVGRPGWNTGALQQRLRRHPEFGRRLLWLDDADDADLQLLYANARGAVNCAVAEGFGLPLVEAALRGVPVIASDIAVFREVGGDGPRYFDLLDSKSLAAAIDDVLARPRLSPRIKTISWRESALELVRLIREEAYQFPGEAPAITSPVFEP